MQIHSTNHYRWQASLLLKKRKEKKPVYGPPARGFEGNSRSPEGEFTPHAVNACRCILPPTASSLSRVSTCAPRRYRKMITGWKFGCNCYDHLPAINHSPPYSFLLLFSLQLGTLFVHPPQDENLVELWSGSKRKFFREGSISYSLPSFLQRYKFLICSEFFPCLIERRFWDLGPKKK